ncbi:MAG: hypothetical protein L0212_11560 [Acidobacteria bacterium]|nr:hypothetical protein [Acidobacteriota bacterium]
MRRAAIPIAVVLVLLGPIAFAKDKPDERLREVNTIFVKGSGSGAYYARKIIRKKDARTCFELAKKEEEADAILEVVSEQKGETYYRSPSILLPPESSTDYEHILTLTLRESGEIVWERSSDEGFWESDKGITGALYKLGKDADCKERRKKKKN